MVGSTNTDKIVNHYYCHYNPHILNMREDGLIVLLELHIIHQSYVYVFKHQNS